MKLEGTRATDMLVFVLLSAAILYIGLFPNGMLHVFHSSVGHLLQQAITSKI